MSAPSAEVADAIKRFRHSTWGADRVGAERTSVTLADAWLILSALDAGEKAQPQDPPRERLHCPNCGAQHVDEGEWATRAHHRHLCGVCGIEWEQGYLSFGAVPGVEPQGARVMADLGYGRLRLKGPLCEASILFCAGTFRCKLYARTTRNGLKVCRVHAKSRELIPWKGPQ